MFRCNTADIMSGTLGWSDAAGDDFRMNKHLIYIALLFIVVIAAAQTAIANPNPGIVIPVTVELAEKTPPVDGVVLDPLDPPDTTTTTTTTTTTLPTIPRCPDRPIAGVPTESRDGTNYWAFNDGMLCDHYLTPGMAVVYCFENPWVDVNRSDRVDWEMPGDPFSWWRGIFASGFDEPVADAGANPGFAETVAGTGASHPETCYICNCARFMGCCRTRGEDTRWRTVRSVRSKTFMPAIWCETQRRALPVKVGKVIEGSEALPLIRFGFEGTHGHDKPGSSGAHRRGSEAGQ